MDDKYAAQKRYLASKKQLKVWMSADKYERFKSAVSANNTSMYAVINSYVDAYLEKAGD